MAPTAADKARIQLKRAIEKVFAKGFHDEKGTLRPMMGAEGQLALAYVFLKEGLNIGQVEAVAMAVRSVGDGEPHAPLEKPSQAQTAKLEGLMREADLPSSFAVTLECALPRIVLRRDLYALYGLLQGTLLRMRGIEDTRALDG